MGDRFRPEYAINLGPAADLLTIGLNLTTLAPAAFKNHAPPVQANVRLH